MLNAKLAISNGSVNEMFVIGTMKVGPGPIYGTSFLMNALGKSITR